MKLLCRKISCIHQNAKVNNAWPIVFKQTISVFRVASYWNLSKYIEVIDRWLLDWPTKYHIILCSKRINDDRFAENRETFCMLHATSAESRTKWPFLYGTSRLFKSPLIQPANYTRTRNILCYIFMRVIALPACASSAVFFFLQLVVCNPICRWAYVHYSQIEK